MAEPFRISLPLRFADCDPAGIAYYPRLFALCDAAIEDWTAAVLGVPRRELHLEQGFALPTVHLHADFAAVSMLGEVLDIDVTVTGLGRTSVELAAAVSCAGEPRFTVAYKQVLMRMADRRPLAWPDGWRGRLEAAR